MNGVVDDDMHQALAHQSYKAGKFKQALEHCSLIYEKYPQRTDILLLLGAIYYQVFVCFVFVADFTSFIIVI